MVIDPHDASVWQSCSQAAILFDRWWLACKVLLLKARSLFFGNYQIQQSLGPTDAPDKAIEASFFSTQGRVGALLDLVFFGIYH